MNNKLKVEQAFILLMLLVCVLIAIGISGCESTPTYLDGTEGSIVTCGKNSCLGCGFTCGTIGNDPYWDCSKPTGCMRYYTGCIESNGKTGCQFGFACGGCFGCLVGDDGSGHLNYGVNCVGCSCGDVGDF
jgi:hypothetical protein